MARDNEEMTASEERYLRWQARDDAQTLKDKNRRLLAIVCAFHDNYSPVGKVQALDLAWSQAERYLTEMHLRNATREIPSSMHLLEQEQTYTIPVVCPACAEHRQHTSAEWSFHPDVGMGESKT
jgi:hypothetical protein